MSVVDRDLGWKAIKREMAAASHIEAAVGIHDGEIAQYATYNEFGTKEIPSRPFMRIALDENKSAISKDFEEETNKLVTGKTTARISLLRIGLKHAKRIQKVITGRNIPPPLDPKTVARKKGSTKTLVDTGAMVNAVTAIVRGRR